MVVEFPAMPGDQGSPEVPWVVASRTPGAVNVPPFPWVVVRTRPGGIWPVTFHEPMLSVFVIVKPIGVIASPTVASNAGSAPLGLGVSVVARVVAPAMESTAPRAAAAAAADFMRLPTGEAATNSSATATIRSTGER